MFKTPAIAAVLIGRQGDNGTSGRISKLTLLVMDYTSPPSTMTMQPGRWASPVINASRHNT